MTLYELALKEFKGRVLPIEAALSRENFVFDSKKEFEKFLDEKMYYQGEAKMNVDEVESYYGKEAADWVRGKIADGTFKLPVAVRLLNPKYERGYLKMNDVIPYDEYGLVIMPDHLRYSDTVRIEAKENNDG